MEEYLIKPDDYARFTDVYHNIAATCEAFSRVSPHIPRNYSEITQHIYGRFDTALEKVHLAANRDTPSAKIALLIDAQDCLFAQYASIELIVKGRGLTVGQANTVLVELKKAHEGVKRWYTYLRTNGSRC